MIKVDRRIGEYIKACVTTSNHRAFILTGHAGDGKTSILFQVLKSLDRLHGDAEMKILNEYPDLFCVKDMSEISEDQQVNVLRKALESPNNHQTSLLISNTGPLLRAFIRLVEIRSVERNIDFNDGDKMLVQSILLSQLDQNKEAPIFVDDYEFTLINIARVDNVSFSVQILKKILDARLWSACENCTKMEVCPIKNNRDCVSRQFDRVSSFVENFYRYLYENDKRMTIRQMIGQLSYALTGSLTCERVTSTSLKASLFNYNFANLFFGFWGLKERKECLQIKGIEHLQVLNLEGIALNVDYDLFVKCDYRFFLPEIQSILNNLQRMYRSQYKIYDEELMSSKSVGEMDYRLRSSIRRFYLMYSLSSEYSDVHEVLNQVFGISYTDYQRLVMEKQSKAMLRRIRDLVFRALYIKNTGFLPDSDDSLPLTLRREDSVFQNVMLVLGMVSKNDLEIIQEPKSNCYEDFAGKQQILLKINDKFFPLSLPMISYFNELISGAIASNNNPALTHGIATLDALLIEQYGDELPMSKDDCEIAVIINTTRGQDIKRFAFDGNSLSIL
jgi:hypothetical protein